MPNTISPFSRRANFIIDKEFYAGLEAEAARKRSSVGELIRTALEDKYPELVPQTSCIVKIRAPGVREVITLTKAEFEKLKGKLGKL